MSVVIDTINLIKNRDSEAEFDFVAGVIITLDILGGFMFYFQAKHNNQIVKNNYFVQFFTIVFTLIGLYIELGHCLVKWAQMMNSSKTKGLENEKIITKCMFAGGRIMFMDIGQVLMVFIIMFEAHYSKISVFS